MPQFAPCEPQSARLISKNQGSMLSDPGTQSFLGGPVHDLGDHLASPSSLASLEVGIVVRIRGRAAAKEPQGFARGNRVPGPRRDEDRIPRADLLRGTV